MWASNRDLKLLSWISDLPKLNSIATTYKQYKLTRRPTSESRDWVIGQGFKPFHPDSRSSKQRLDFTIAEEVTKVPFLSATRFTPWVMPEVRTAPWPEAKVHRAGYVGGFTGPHVLVPQGVQRREGLIRAAYVEQSLCFQHSLQAITFPIGQEPRAKLLTAVLNSSLAAWYYFHTSANLGADRAKVHEEQLLDLPFPDPDETPNPNKSHDAQQKIIGMMNHLLEIKDNAFAAAEIEAQVQRVDELVFDYYGLDDDERILITDSLRFIVPGMQPRRDVVTALTQHANSPERVEYCETLARAVRSWLRPGTDVGVRLIEGGSDAAVVELRLNVKWKDVLVDPSTSELQSAMAGMLAQLPEKSSRNIEVQPNLKVFVDDSLYLTKPLSRRYG